MGTLVPMADGNIIGVETRPARTTGSLVGMGKLAGVLVMWIAPSPILGRILPTPGLSVLLCPSGQVTLLTPARGGGNGVGGGVIGGSKAQGRGGCWSCLS